MHCVSPWKQHVNIELLEGGRGREREGEGEGEGGWRYDYNYIATHTHSHTDTHTHLKGMGQVSKGGVLDSDGCHGLPGVGVRSGTPVRWSAHVTHRRDNQTRHYGLYKRR